MQCILASVVSELGVQGVKGRLKKFRFVENLGKIPEKFGHRCFDTLVLFVLSMRLTD